jgi:C1A family cysteine protease
MAHFLPRGFGWLPSVPDFRDFTLHSPAVTELLHGLGPADGETAADNCDLREYFLDADDQLDLNTSPAHACIGLVQYFERRSLGRVLRPSRLFLHQNALKFSGGSAGVDLRTTLCAMVRCGIPPERYWPYETQRREERPEPFLYSFDEPYRGIRYVRLDGRNATGRETLQTVKAFLRAGFPSCFGFSVPSSLTIDGQIPYRPTFDSPLGGQAMIAVGYDDRWLRGSRGALLVRSSWGQGWGDDGYGWLPYAYVEERLAVDFFTLLHPAWIASGEFESPL